MTPLVAAFAVAGGIVGAGLVAAEGLRRRQGDSDLVVNLRSRTRAWAVMLAVLALAFAGGRAGVVLLFAILSALSLREMLAVFGPGPMARRAAVLLFAVALPAQYLLVLTGWYGLFVVLLPVYAVLPVSLAALAGGPSGYLQRMAALQVALLLGVFALSHVPGLFLLTFEGFAGSALWPIAWLLFTVQLSDVAQYVWGKLYGRRKLAPVLSPSKTWEGLAGGMATAVVAGVAMHGLTPFGPLGAAAMAVVVTAAGALGGIVMSAIKRDRGAKDWGHILPGHGGITDRIDSLIFAAPVFFHLSRWFWSLT